MKEFKKASDKERKNIRYNVNLSEIEDIPVTRKEKIDAIFEIALRGYERHKGYNLQKLIAKLSVKWGVSRKTIKSYLYDLERAEYIRYDERFRVIPNLDKVKSNE